MRIFPDSLHHITIPNKIVYVQEPCLVVITPFPEDGFSSSLPSFVYTR